MIHITFSGCRKALLSLNLTDVNMASINLTSDISISLQCGFSQGLSIELQPVSKYFEEDRILEAG